MKIVVSPKQLNGSSFLWGAHHPHCDKHSNHLIWIGNHPLCLGCTCMYTGIILGLPISLLVDWTAFSFVGWIFFHWTLLFPTVLQTKLQHKLFKILSRTLLGICITLYLLSGLVFLELPFTGWLFYPSVIIAFYVFYRVMSAVRTRLTKSPCEDCPLGYYPTCEWNLPRLLNENDDLILREALLESSITKNSNGSRQ